MRKYIVALVLLCASAAFAQNALQTVILDKLPKPAAGGGGGSVTVDVVGSEKYNGTTGSTSISYTGLTTGTPSGLAVVCTLTRADSTNDVTAGVAMTWNGVSMTKVASVNNNTFLKLSSIYGLHNPSSGAQTAVMSATNTAADNFIACMSFGGVNQTSDAAAFPNNNTGQGVTSVNVTTVTTTHYVVGAYCGGVILANIIGTAIFTDNSMGAICNAGADYIQSASSSQAIGSTTATMSTIAGVDVSP